VTALLIGLLSDLAAESQELDETVAVLSPVQWAVLTPAAGWTIAHQIAHLAWTDELSLRAACDPDGFRTTQNAARSDLTTRVDAAAANGATVAPCELLSRWRTARAALSSALAEIPPHTAIPWLGPDLSAPSMVTARLMETWAHGVDVRDALDHPTRATTRLRAVAHLGVRTRDYAFRQYRLSPPPEEFRVELTGPDHQVWTWGPAEATQRVTGPALDFCLCVTRRRHRDDLALRTTGGEADRWLDIAQAFAGPAGTGRSPTSPDPPPRLM
jgi:uncharacterized protein (TIGR03084 family)